MQLKVRITGVRDDVQKYVDTMKNAIPDNVISVSRFYPQTRYDKDSKEVACYITIGD